MRPERGRDDPSPTYRIRGSAALPVAWRRPHLLKKRAPVLKARKSVPSPVTSEAIESLADAEPEPWSIQAVERAEAVADDALAETKLAFSGDAFQGPWSTTSCATTTSARCIR